MPEIFFLNSGTEGAQNADGGDNDNSNNEDVLSQRLSATTITAIPARSEVAFHGGFSFRV